MKYRIYFWLAIGAVPLLVYPFLLVANVISLAAESPSYPVPLGLRLSSQAFLWSSTLYPAVYLVCATLAIVSVYKMNLESARKMSLVPLFYLTLIVAFFGAWMITGQ